MLRTLSVLALPSIVSDIAGERKASASGPDGGQGFDIEFTFKVVDGKITGTAVGPMGEMSISEVRR